MHDACTSALRDKHVSTDLASCGASRDSKQRVNVAQRLLYPSIRCGGIAASAVVVRPEINGSRTIRGAAKARHCGKLGLALAKLLGRLAPRSW